MARGRVGDGPEIEEVWSGARPADGGRPGRLPGGGRRRRPGIRRWLPVFAVSGLAVMIVGAGLLGPKVPAPGAADDGTSTAAPEATAGPSGAPDASRAPDASGAPDASRAPIALFRRSGDALPDQHVLVAGRWMHLGTGGSIGGETGCERERVLVLSTGRIVCVAETVIRSPGSTVARYDLRAITLGRVRLDPAQPPPTDRPVAADAGEDLITLVGRRDLVVGSPVAIAVAAGPGADEVLLAWAARDAGDFRLGLDRYRLRDSGEPQAGRPSAAWTGHWDLGRPPATGSTAVDTIGDLLVSPDQDGARVLVGWTEAGPGISGAVRRLVVVRPAGQEPPATLPADVTRNLDEEAADGTSRPGTPCGGAFGEGFATDRTVFVVCPGATAELRRIEVSEPARTPGLFGAVTATTRLEPGLGIGGSAWLAGNGVAIDRSRGFYYRWSPWARTLWKVDLAARDATGGQPVAERIVIEPPAGSIPVQRTPSGPNLDGPDAVEPGPLPLLALDEAAGRLYLLGMPAAIAAASGAQEPGIVVVGVAHLRPVVRWTIAETEARSIALSPDRRYLYLATAPRPAAGPSISVGVAVHDASLGGEVAYAGRLRVGAGAPLEAVIVR